MKNITSIGAENQAPLSIKSQEKEVQTYGRSKASNKTERPGGKKVATGSLYSRGIHHDPWYQP